MIPPPVITAGSNPAGSVAIRAVAEVATEPVSVEVSGFEPKKTPYLPVLLREPFINVRS